MVRAIPEMDTALVVLFYMVDLDKERDKPDYRK